MKRSRPMRWIGRVTGLGCIAAVVSAFSCSDDTPSVACTPGRERCACYGNDTCDEPFVCASDICVRVDSGAGGAAHAGGGGSAGDVRSGGAAGQGGVRTGGAAGQSSGGDGGGTIRDASVTDAAPPAPEGGKPEPSDGGTNVDGGTPFDGCTAAELASFAGAPATAVLDWLYPYDGTVLPRGLAAPTLMWKGADTATRARIVIESKHGVFRDCLDVKEPGRVQPSAELWSAVERASPGTADDLTITLTTASATTVFPAIGRSLKLASAPLPGSVLYDSYTSKLSPNNGAILKLVLGDSSPALYLTNTSVGAGGPCRSCHSISVSGKVMIASNYLLPGIYFNESYKTTPASATLWFDTLPVPAAFAAISPDGAIALSNGAPNPSLSILFPTADGNVAFAEQGTSWMIDLKNGEAFRPNEPSAHAQMTMFSPDGKQVVYNDYDDGNGHSLWVANFDAATLTFSDKKKLFTDATRYPGWPTFTPDGKKVVFCLGTRADFASQTPDLGGPPAMTPTGRSHLVIVDVASLAARKLDLANGNRSGQSYLPAGAARDGDLDFFPSMSPVVAAGYTWVFFTSRRTYGNLSTKGLEDPITKKIWVAAIDVAVAAGTDPSHPAFFLPGQETASGNFRATHVPAW